MNEGELAVLLARLEVKLDQLLILTGDHESRLRSLEGARWPIPVAAVIALLSVGGSALGAWGA